MIKINHFAISVLTIAAVTGIPPALAAYNEHRPVCSPDGKSLIFMLQSEHTRGDWELFLLEMDSEIQSRLTYHAGWDGYAVWSPDGSQIVFDRADKPDGPKHPWLMELAGRTSKPLGNFKGWLSISDWSDDGRLLGFHELDGQRDLFLLDTDGNITRQLTDTPGHSEHDAHFSPDGKKIAYANGVIDGSGTSLELLDLECGDKSILHTSIGRIYGLSWSPDGAGIAYVDAPGGDEDDADIFMYNLADQVTRQVTDDPAWDHMPEFCNDNHVLFYTSYRSGEERMYRIDPNPRPMLKIERAGE